MGLLSLRFDVNSPRSSPGIGKGQVSGFVNFMRSDLDLATKTECMEAIRLTEGKANRLLRFVKSGGVTKIAGVPDTIPRHTMYC